jgi:hypothetical protein
VRVPESVVRRKPVVFVAKTVGMIVSAAMLVNVNVKVPPPPVVEGTLTTILVPSGPGGATAWVRGVKVTVEPDAIPKFCPTPDDAPLVPGLMMVFVVVAAVMRAPVLTVATPPPPGTKPKVPVAGTAYAVLLINAATNPAAPASLSPDFPMSQSPFQP